MPSQITSKSTLLLLFACATAMAAPAAKSNWIKFTTPHFELYTDAGERKGRDVLKRIDQLRQVLQDIPRSENAPQAPVRIFLFNKDREYRNYKPASAAGLGYHEAGADRDYLVMQGTGGDTYRTVFHEYTHMVLNRSSIRMPRWIEEGTAEYYSTVSPDGNLRARLGKPISVHQKTLKNTAAWLKPDSFQAVRRDSVGYKEQLRSGIFYAQPWVLVHQVISTNRYNATIARYAELLADGHAYAPAFMGAFGRPVETAWKELALYVKRNKYQNLRFDLAPDTTSRMKGEKLSLGDIALPLADLQLVIGNDKLAEPALKLIAADSETPTVLTALGTLALRKRNFEEAKVYFERAVEENSALGASYFGLAMTLRETNGSPEAIVENLKKCVEMSPNFAEAHFLLGTMAASEKRYQDAVDHLRLAATAYPKIAAYWHSLSMAHYHMKEGELARRAAYKAYFAASTEQETAMVMATLNMVDGRQVHVAAPSKADVSALASTADRKGDTRLNGTLIRVDCLGHAARFHVLAGDKRVLLYALRPQEISLKNFTSETREFVCGPQKKLTVSVEYNARPDASFRSAGDVVSIEFKAN